jgi:non-heme chloroperoxidase
MQTLLQGLRYGVRMLMKNFGFTLIAVPSLALGIGANTAIFSAVNAVLHQALPFPKPDRLVMVSEAQRLYRRAGYVGIKRLALNVMTSVASKRTLHLFRYTASLALASILFVPASCESADNKHADAKVTKAQSGWQDPSPHRVRYVSVEKDVQLEVLDWGGSGRGIVLLAGSGYTAHEYDDFAPKLTDHYHVYGITRRGFGSSGFVAGKHGIDLLGNDILAVIAMLKLKRPILVGHSFAGGELSSVATRYPNRIAGLVYLDAAYPVAFDNGKGMSMSEFQEIVRAPIAPPPPEASDLTSFRALQTYYERVYGIRLPEGELRQQWEAVPDGRVGKRRSFPGSSTLMMGLNKYTDIPVPALVIFANPHSLSPWLNDNQDASVRAAVKAYSSKFEAFTRKQENAIREAVHTARVITLPGANHVVFMSNEADVIREMRAFFTGLH